MSDLDITELLESPCEWTDYSCESICGMALDEIERLRSRLAEHEAWTGDVLIHTGRLLEEAIKERVEPKLKDYTHYSLDDGL
jgi:hypothetical protein